MSSDEKRKFTRVDVELSITISPKDADRCSGVLKNISMGGAFFVQGEPLPEGAECTLCVEISEPSSVLTAEVEGEVVRADEKGVAIRFTSVDLDNLLRLRQLVTAHCKTPHMIEDEFKASFVE